MILYISDLEKMEIFDDYLDNQNIFLDFKELGTQPLKNLVSKERNMPNYKHVVFFFSDSTYYDEVLETIDYLTHFHHAKVIVFAPESQRTSMLFGELINIGIREVVSYNEDTDLTTELEECLSYEGKSFTNSIQTSNNAKIEEMRSHVRPVLEIPDNFTLSLAIAGVQSRTGVTTQCFAFYHTLKELGFNPCIIDIKQEFISALLTLYGDDNSVNGSILNIREMNFTHDVQVGTGHNAFIYDLGVLGTTTKDLFGKSHIRLLCSGAKGWELPILSSCLVAHPQLAQRLILSFVADTDEAECNELLSGLIPISFAPYSPDIWKQGSNKWQDEFLIPMIKELMTA